MPPCRRRAQPIPKARRVTPVWPEDLRLGRDAATGALPDAGPAGKEPRAHEDEQSDQPRGQEIAHPHPEPRRGPHRLQTGHGRVGRQVIGARIPCVPRQSD
jgi:hypothetical protein